MAAELKAEDRHWPQQCSSQLSKCSFFKSQITQQQHSLPTTLGFWQRWEVPDVEEIQEYLWKDLVFHDYSL